MLTLLPSHRRLGPDQTFELGLLVAIPEGWHIYWLNPGDSGEATSLDWQGEGFLPEAELRWTGPEERLLSPGEIVHYAYRKQAGALLSLRSDDQLRERELRVEVEYLLCRELCQPGQIQASVLLPGARRGREDRSVRPSLEQLKGQLPRPLPEEVRWAEDPAQLRLEGIRAEAVYLFEDLQLEEQLQSWEWLPGESGIGSLVLQLRSEAYPAGGESVLRVLRAGGEHEDWALPLPSPGAIE